MLCKTAQVIVSDVTMKVKHFYLDFQTPTSKQSRYKEQVAEMRKGRNSSLQKEQKEKHMVTNCHSQRAFVHLRFDTPCVTITTGTPLVLFYVEWFTDISIFIFLSGLQEHRQTHANTREPLLENITSDYDLELFRKAQARASEDLVMGCLIYRCHSCIKI